MAKGFLVLLMLVCPFLVRFWHQDEISAAKQLLGQAVGKLPWRLMSVKRS
jgi:hypothetical protein